jgi:hypothetical protein
MSAFPVYVRPLQFLTLAGAALIAPFLSSSGQAAEVGCTKICAQIIQAIGDDIKEQIPLDCIQETGACTGKGYFQTADERVPVVITGGLASNTLTLTVIGDKGAFTPADQPALVMPLTPGDPYQATQFVVGQKSGDTPFANAGTSLTVTVIAERLM